MTPQEQNARWTNEANIERYGKILRSNLTDLERRFVERRLEEEKARQYLPERQDDMFSAREFCP
jgi:hypothetical protein